MTDEQTQQDTAQDAAAREKAGVATAEQNAALTHSDQDAPESTRDDALDAGVPMLPTEGDEPTGPEDALGEGSKRGDYTKRVGDAQHFESRANPQAGEPIRDEDGNIVDYQPAFSLVAQNPRVEDIGDVPGEKGGVTTG